MKKQSKQGCCHHCARACLWEGVYSSGIQALLSNCSYNCGLAASLLLVLSAWLWCWHYYYMGVCSCQHDGDVGVITTWVSVLVSMIVMLALLLHRCLFLSAWLWCWHYYYIGVSSRQSDVGVVCYFTGGCSSAGNRGLGCLLQCYDQPQRH